MTKQTTRLKNIAPNRQPSSRTMPKPTVRLVISHAVSACKSFAKCSRRFFNFEKKLGWAGWEDWLTVEVIRRLNSPTVTPFSPYSDRSGKLDIRIDNPKIAVEIKVTYISDDEVEKWQNKWQNDGESRALTGRFLTDANKLAAERDDTIKLLLLAAVFDSQEGAKKYALLVRNDISTNYKRYPKRKWYDCSKDDGCIRLLAMVSSGNLPSQQQADQITKLSAREDGYRK